MFVRDGTLYFFAIFMANLMNVIIYMVSSLTILPRKSFSNICTWKSSPPDLKAIGASCSHVTASREFMIVNGNTAPTGRNPSTFHLLNMADNRCDSPQQQHRPIFSVLIVGCGLSGLASALALAQAGHRVTVFERSAKLQEVRDFGFHILSLRFNLIF